MLESDGTHIDDEEYLRWLPDNTTFLLLRGGETWTKPVQESQACEPETSEQHVTSHHANDTLSSPIPRVVCDALNLLEVHHEPPFWKIIDNRGRITLVLHWEQPRNNCIRYVEPRRPTSQTSSKSKMQDIISESNNMAGSRSLADINIHSVPVHPSEDMLAVVVSEDGATATISRSSRMQKNVDTQPSHPNPTTALSGRDRNRGDNVKSISAAHQSIAMVHSPAMPKATGPSTITYAGKNIQNPHYHQQHTREDCEFHCGSLHERGRFIKGAETPSGTPLCRSASNGQQIGATNKTTHVRFHAVANNKKTIAAESQQKPPSTKATNTSAISSRKNDVGFANRDSSESEMEPESNTTIDDECDNEVSKTTNKFLLLIDQLSTDQRKHLTILDLGVILERLKAKIVDVERLEREREGPSCFRWIIKATIRGEVLRDLGVLYNGNYYSISEDNGTACTSSGFEYEEQDGEAKL